MGEVHRGSKLRYFNEKPDIRTQTILVKQNVYSCNNGGDHIQPLATTTKTQAELGLCFYFRALVVTVIICGDGSAPSLPAQSDLLVPSFLRDIPQQLLR